MIAEARALNPDLRFEQRSMLALDPSFRPAGIVAFYSIIHVPRQQQAAMYCHWRERLLTGGHVLVAFHIGDEIRHLDELWGEPVSLDFIFYRREQIEGWLNEAGFKIVESRDRPPYPGVEAETRRAYILARNDAPTT